MLQPRPRALLGACSAILVASLSPVESRAASILQVSFAGVVETLTPGIVGGPFAPGDPVTGTLIVDLSVVDTVTSSAQGLYPSAVISFDFVIGEYSGGSAGTAGPQNYVDVANNRFFPSPGIDAFVARSPAQGPAVNGFVPSYVQFAISSFDTTILSSDAIPTPAEIEAFLPSYLRFNDGTNFLRFGSERLDWRVDSFTAVPEPATGALLLLGMVALGIGRRRRG